MKKILKNRIFIVIITLMIGISGTLYATTKYQASEILFNPSSGDSMTVNEALNELYNKCGNSSSVSEPVSFAEDSWETIVANVKLGNTSKYKVGDTKEISLTGFTNEEEGSNGLYTIRIANTSTPDECLLTDFSQTACGFVIEFVDIITTYSMNASLNSAGGWRDCLMRPYVNYIIYSALPKELRENIIDTYVVSGYGDSDTANFTTTDKIYLLSTKEVWGNSTIYDTVNSETRQLDYYANLGVTANNNSGTRKNYNDSNINWWLRSALGSNAFYDVRDSRLWINNYASYSHGVAPAFRIG